jgi:hypothetical protein
MNSGAQQWDTYVSTVNTFIAGCGNTTGGSCTTNDPSSIAFGTYLDTTQWSGLGATINGLNSPGFFQYITGKAGTAGLTKPVRTIYDNSVGAGIWTLSANGTATYTLASASPVPVPAAIWLFGSGLLGLVGVSRRKRAA